jgi:hypothetical protein
MYIYEGVKQEIRECRLRDQQFFLSFHFGCIKVFFFFFFLFVCTLNTVFLRALYSIHSQELLEVAATDFIAGIASVPHVLAHPLKDLWRVLIVSRAATILAAKSSSVSTGFS